MKNIRYFSAVVAVFVFVMGFIFVVSALDDIMTVEANILPTNGGGSKIIRVEVPDYLFFGNVTKGMSSDELKVYVNNTGNVDIAVTPKLTNSSEEIFNHLFFRKFKTSGGAPVNFTRIGNFSFNVSKPTSGSDYNDEYFYVILNLSDYSGSVSSAMMGRRANVKFFAVEE